MNIIIIILVHMYINWVCLRNYHNVNISILDFSRTLFNMRFILILVYQYFVMHSKCSLIAWLKNQMLNFGTWISNFHTHMYKSVLFINFQKIIQTCLKWFTLISIALVFTRDCKYHVFTTLTDRTECNLHIRT